MNQPLAKQAYGKIIEMILSGALTPGDALQEAKLGDLLDMSRTPVREAIKRIEAEGLATQEGRFLKIRRLKAEEVEEIFFLRQVLETHCARQAVMARPELGELEARIRHLQQHGPGEDDEQRRVDDAFHRTLALSTGSEMMVSTIEDLRRRTCMFDHAQVPDRFLKSCDEHLEMIAALRAGDGERAGALMARHIVHARDAILEKLEQFPERNRDA
ncbi:GntR family transcriptional regulator (plasmid) [Agrobacterium tumefaciens]|uniref:GntR family transcriptional regulator n=1 Tax=Agrobacterium tumefaciens TaxID=358 RepID=UPI0015737A74|nr:GntR family transcriptional regulator [Agrobacterium tumefaciens]NSZ66164.1 GntR family transcriptional regulator [Agrobacterium tumefaciens]NTA72536.1 GntR family transcriptional regulator [Agrobacterium tumefaciens]WIE41777.1 GntR family transcriptional regulator [Agrobacterium tumefaciens]